MEEVPSHKRALCQGRFWARGGQLRALSAGKEKGSLAELCSVVDSWQDSALAHGSCTWRLDSQLPQGGLSDSIPFLQGWREQTVSFPFCIPRMHSILMCKGHRPSICAMCRGANTCTLPSLLSRLAGQQRSLPATRVRCEGAAGQGGRKVVEATHQDMHSRAWLCICFLRV